MTDYTTSKRHCWLSIFGTFKPNSRRRTVDKNEVDAMIEAHKEASWRHGFLCGFAWAALAVLLAAGISAVWTMAHQPAKVDVLKIEKKK